MPSSYDTKRDTFDLVICTELPTFQESAAIGEPFYEILDLSPGSVRMDRMTSGRAALLSNHGLGDGNYGQARFGLDKALGVLSEPRVVTENGVRKMIATARFSARASIAEVRQDVRDGILQNTSADYRVYRYRDETKPGDHWRTLRAIDWEPVACSLTTVPAETATSTRASPTTHAAEIIGPDGAADPMPTKTKTEPVIETENPPVIEGRAASDTPPPVVEGRAAGRNPPPVVEPSAAGDDATLRAQAVAEERGRIQGIRSISAMAGVQDDDFVDGLINRGLSLEGARAAIHTRWAGEGSHAPVSSRVTVGEEEHTKVRGAVEGAILVRAFPDRYPLDKAPEGSRDFIGMSLLEIGRDLLERRGVKTRGMSKDTLAGRALHTTSDFPSVLENISTKTLRSGYAEAPATWAPLASRGTLPDFKPASRVQFGNAANLDELVEGEAITSGTIGEGKETVQLKSYAKMIGISRRTIINDDLQAFTRAPMLMGNAARRLESDLFWALVLANPALADTVAVFHSTHKNSITDALAEAGLAAARVKLGLQTTLEGVVMNLMGRYLVVPLALQTTAEKLVSTIQPVTSGGVNPFAGKLQVIAEGRLDIGVLGQTGDVTDWYYWGDSNACETIEMDYLEGSEGPRIESRVGFEVPGVQIKVEHDVGGKWLDFRNVVKATVAG